MNFFFLFTLSLLQMKGFTVHKIESHHPYQEEWDVATDLPADKLNQILSQSYHYLASGKECYVFSSDDEQYVIKFFKQKHMDTTGLRPKKRRDELRKKTFSSYKIAYERLREETQLLYLHLTKSQHLKRKLHLTDNFHRPFTLDLDQAEFLIQRQGTPLLAYLEDKPEEVRQKMLAKLKIFIQNRIDKGIHDADNNCERNLGVIEGEIFEIDIGEFSLTNEEFDVEKEIYEATKDLMIHG
ncbi:MAG: hypothetical protein SNF33_02080 [Candidatus Algichlamydia australiensis]|nr:hypothetical protein [Chlamydiales bacterium]